MSEPYAEPAEPASELARDDHWQRLDPRMLLVHPIREIVRFLPVLLGIFIAGSASEGPIPWHYLGVVIPVVLGLLRYLTTSFRISGGRVELQRGLLSRHVLSTPLDRVRTVDLTSSPVHRLLGLTTVRVGTGTASTKDEDRLDLDGLPVERARLLREALLRSAPDAHDAHDAPDAPGADPAYAGHPGHPGHPGRSERVVVRFDPSWVRFAPLTSSGLVIAAGVLGAATQLFNLAGGFQRLDPSAVVDNAGALSIWLAVPVGVLGLLVVVSALSIGGYLVANWGFTLTHAESGHGGAWHLRRGLLTTRETSVDDERVAGVSLAEPLGLRLAGGASLAAIVTGLDSKQQGSSSLVPPAPRAEVGRVAAEVLGRPGPVVVPLTGHGSAARRRRWTRALVPAAALAAAALLGVLLLDAPAWTLTVLLLLPVTAALAADRSRSLGHALSEGYVVTRSGSLTRRREALGVDHVIGWNLRSTWFQRRVGLTTLVATTAGGRQSVSVLDVPEEAALALAGAAMPQLIDQFRDRPVSPPPR